MSVGLVLGEATLTVPSSFISANCTKFPKIAPGSSYRVTSSISLDDLAFFVQALRGDALPLANVNIPHLLTLCDEFG
jgi:hypothetical protein